MKGRYSQRINGYDSEYESDGNTKYSVDAELGQGSQAIARRFKNKNNTKAIAVLHQKNNVTTNWNIVNTKFNFFKTLYRDQNVDLIEIDNKKNYRLVLPLIPGETYTKLRVTDQTIVQVLQSAILALKECHQQGLVVLDLKSDNILYDAITDKSYLIDGGMAVEIGKRVPSCLQVDPSRIENCKILHWHIAPECWSDTSAIVNAHPSMDVYSLGKLFATFKTTREDVKKLIQACIISDPEKRPSLNELDKRLNDILLSSNRDADEVTSVIINTLASITETSTNTTTLSINSNYSMSPSSSINSFFYTQNINLDLTDFLNNEMELMQFRKDYSSKTKISKANKINRLQDILDYINENIIYNDDSETTSIKHLIHSVCALKRSHYPITPTSQNHFETKFSEFKNMDPTLNEEELGLFQCIDNIPVLLAQIYLKTEFNISKSQKCVIQ